MKAIPYYYFNSRIKKINKLFFKVKSDLHVAKTLFSQQILQIKSSWPPIIMLVYYFVVGFDTLLMRNLS